MMQKTFLAGTLALTVALTGAAQAQSLANGIFGRLFGFGEDPPPINYSERAPLVVPPKRELRQPGAPINEALAQDPSWPKDPDAAKARKSASLTHGPAPGRDELMPGDLAVRGGGLDQRTPSQIEQQEKRSDKPVSPLVLRRKGTFGASAPPLTPGVEPPRRSLIDPPPGLRMPAATASVDGNVVLPSEAEEEANKSFLDRINPFN